MFAWKCASCHSANLRHVDICRYCGGTSKIKLQPVAVANAQQNTPNHEVLTHILEAEELARSYDTRSFEEQIENRKQLIQQRMLERATQHLISQGKAPDEAKKLAKDVLNAAPEVLLPTFEKLDDLSPNYRERTLR